MPTPIKKIAECSTSSECEPKKKVQKGKRIIVSGEDDCDSQLNENGCCLPAIPVQINKNEVELRDGSKRKPIKLPCLQSTETPKVSHLVIVKGDGTVSKWTPPQVCGEYKLVVKDGMIEVKQDGMPSTLSEDVCEAECDGVDFLLGVKQMIITCADGSKRTVNQIKMVPKSCCTAEELTSIEAEGIGQE